ncbi:protein-L-isoaspartate O-methyltransferase 1-like isoform X2 [Tripterygium wilfordii]|uniref:protein-L-isoaspartate O-methyltransferase 1-like isoform X2 n=1 Tax=Tripterygium wilfordii TaxID=458696 RepID=UPI0018F7E82D|nr:protein-L-isoaspartate O-methyltransferase 1-like isoform X2 [Tripterygium wilfordii]
MPTPISLSTGPGVVRAYGCRYITPPLKRLLAYTLLHNQQHNHSHRPRLPLFSTLSSFHLPPNLNRLLTGDCPFSGMERYWTGSTNNKNKAMVENLRRDGVITSKKLLQDNLQSGMHALDVGSGTGYLTACFALMVGSQGRVVGVEHIPELVVESIKNIEKSAAAPLLKEGALSIHVGDGRQGWPECAPYDAIHVGAAAPEIPKPLIDQLKPGGRMLIPVGNIFQDLKVVDKNQDGSINVRTETSVRYVPLTSREAQWQG